MAQNYGLGRGLSSLIPQKNKKIDKPAEDFNYFGASGKPIANVLEEKNGISEIEISKIIPNPYQPRTVFDETKLSELADSIKEHGIIQPIVVSKSGGQYQIIAGERRFQAAKIAGLSNVPVIIRKTDDQQKLELAIVENVQRQDLNLIEEAKSYLKLTNEFGLTQEEIAKKLGKNRSSVANKVRLLNLPIEIQKALIEGKLTEGHAKLLLAIPNPERQKAFYEMIIKNALTVRQTEDKTKEISVKTHKRNIAIDPEIKSLEDELIGILGTKVKIKKSGGGGQIVIEYYSKEELNNILGKIK
ncbi:MAG: chromosome partitioning protein ParB [Candidatus Moranbacteria bacterium CG23_combo_of_CG06-09_8_20_14_all_35_22]|nr:MAG: chromosome partitioning protein ParB [Candidatus Moranbacteria bacterium CG23_combo_of_CG06-09_8_20_14_all_35_22]